MGMGFRAMVTLMGGQENMVGEAIGLNVSCQSDLLTSIQGHKCSLLY
jgi:hypothetical protein